VGTGVPGPEPGVGDDSLTILENPGLGTGEPMLAAMGAGEADAVAGVGPA
jgi:hypothetical protein